MLHNTPAYFIKGQDTIRKVRKEQNNASFSAYKHVQKSLPFEIGVLNTVTVQIRTVK